MTLHVLVHAILPCGNIFPCLPLGLCLIWDLNIVIVIIFVLDYQLANKKHQIVSINFLSLPFIHIRKSNKFNAFLDCMLKEAK